MAGFRAIAAVGRSIESLLNVAFTIVPPVENEVTRAVLVSTDDLALEADSAIIRPALSILLYRVDFNKTVRASWSGTGAAEGAVRLPLDLHFLVTAWGSNADHEHRILGRTMQVLEEVGALSGPLLDPDGDWLADETVQLCLEDMATDDLMRTFDSLECDFRLSVPYIARVVVLRSEGLPTTEVLTFVSGLAPVTS